VDASHPEAEERREKPRRRVVVPPPEGTDPSPVAEPERHDATDNDERLKADKPPHY
jgi:hypothetical protein